MKRLALTLALVLGLAAPGFGANPTVGSSQVDPGALVSACVYFSSVLQSYVGVNGYWSLGCDAGGNLRVTSNCQQSVAVNVAVAGTTQLIAAVANQRIYVCGFLLVVSAGTTPTVQLEYGTGGSCGTGTTALTGPMAPNTGIPIAYGGNEGPTLTVPLANALCIVAGGTTPAAAGIVTYGQY